MNTQKNRLSAYQYLTAVLALIASGAYLLALVTSYDKDAGYYESGAIFPTLLIAALALTVLLALSALVVFRKDTLTPEAEEALCLPSTLEQILGGITALAFFLVLLKHFHFYYIRQYLPVTKLVQLTLCGLLASALFYLGLYTSPKTRVSNVTLLLGYAALIHPVSVIITSYSDFYTPMNHPAKIMLEMASVVMILFLLVELRLLISATRVSFYIASAVLSIGVLSPVALFGFFYPLLSEKSTVLYRSYCVLCVPVLLFVLARSVRFARLLCNPPAGEDAEIEPTVNDEAVAKEDERNAPAENDTNADGETPSSEESRIPVKDDNESEGETV